MANETDSVFAADQQNGKGELYRLMMSILKEGETDNQETAQQQPTPEVEKANDEPATRQPAAQTVAEPQSVQRPTGQKQERPEQAEQPKGEVEQPAQTVQPVQDVQADELDDDTKDLLAVKNHNIDDARKYVEKLGKEAQTIMASGMSESAKREAQERYENAAKTLNERIETYNAVQKAENERLRADAERKQAQAKKEYDEKYADINYISDWMDGHKVSEANNTMLASEGFKEGAAAASGKDIFGIAKTAKEYISENTGKLSTAAINDYVNGMLAANRLKEKYGDKFSYNLEPIDSLVLENKDIPDSVKKEFVKVRTPKEFGDNNYQSILGNAVDDFVRLFEKEYKREQGNVGKKAMEDYDNIAKNPLADASDKDAARMVYASKVLTGVDLKPMIDRAFNSIPKDRLAALTLALSKDFGYDENKAAEYIANEFQRVCLARTGAKVNSDTEAVIIGGLMNTLVGSIAQASMRSTGGGNGLTLLDAYNASIDERAKEWAKQGMAGYGKIALRSATTMGGDSPLLGGIGKLVGSGTKWSLVRLLPRLSKGVTPKAGEAAFKMLSMTNSGRVVIGVANGAGLGAIYSPAAYSLGSLARGVTPELGEALKSSASGAVDFSMMGFTPSIMNYGADKVLKLFNGTGKAATAIRVATNIAFKDIFGPGANAALVTAKDVLLSSEKISEDLKSYYFEKFGEFLGMHVPGKLSNIRHIADEYKVRTQLNESVFTKEELRSLGYKSVKQMFDDIYAPNGKNSPGYFIKDGKAIASKLYGITVNPKVLESAKMKLLTAIGGGAIATPTITRSEIVSEYGEKGKEVYTVRTYTADGKAFSERDFGSLKDAKLEQTRLGTVIKRNNVAIAEGARDAQWMDTCSERATRTVLSELNGTATEKELTDMLKTAFEKDRNGEQLTDGEKRILKRFDEVYLQNLRSENADNSSSVRRDFNKSRGVDIDKILAKDYYKWSESEREAVDEYIKALNGENTAKDMPSEQTEPTAPSEPPAEPANESPVVEAEKGGQQEVVAPEKETEKPSEETPSKEGVGIEDYIKINKADDETANDIREDAENYTDEVNALRAESEQAVRYSNGESSEKPEHWDYWKEKFGLEEPKAKTEEKVKPMEEPKADSEPIEPADEKPTEQPKEPKAEEKPVEVETPKEEAKADTKTEVEQEAGTGPVEEVDKHKEEQLDIINKSNPMHDEYHTGVRNVDDIKTFEEAVSDSDAPFTPDYTKEDAESALKAGEITVYSSKPIEDGVFVTPSKIEAKNYAGDGKVFSKMVSIKDVAWIDAIEGQYARLRSSDIETGAKESVEREGVAYKKGEELVVEHEGSPMTIVVDAVGKGGDVTKSHVKSSGEPYHSNGKVVFTPKEKPQEQTVKDWVDDTASEARKRGYRIVNGQKVERQGALSEGTEVVYGDEHTTKFSQNDKPTTRFAVVSAKKMQPSHVRGQRNPAFFNDEGQPKNRTDQVSVAREEEIAKNIDPEEITVGVTAYQGAPTINSRGEVIQGNNRAAALREMYSGGYGMSVKKYRQFLKDNAKMFGLTPEDIDRIEDPVLVNVADVADAEAIRLGQLKATDNESGGVQFIEPKPTVQKLVGANKLTRFMDTLLDSENPMDSVKDLIRKNGVKALKFMRDMGIINETQYNSAFNAKDTLSSQARSDLEGVIRHAMFDGGPTGIEEMFDLMPDAAQKGILETIARDFSSDEQSRIKPIIQESILAYHNAVSTSKEFANAKTAEQAARAMRNYARQVQLIGEEQVLPEKYFSKFALLLAERYRAYSKLSIKAMFNELYDKLQGVSESSGDLFAGEVAAEKLNINEAFKKVFNYGDTELPRGDVLGDTARTGEKGEPGSEGGTGGRGQDKTGERGADGQGGTGGTAEEGPNSLIGTASKVADRERVNSRLKDLSERAKTAKTDEERAQVASERAEVVSEYMKGEKGRSVSVVPTQDALADAVESRDLKNEVRQHTESGDLLNGVYDKRTGKIHIVAENVETADDIDAVYIHESSHKYSREVDNNRAAGGLVDNNTTEELEQALREVAGDDVADVYMACKASKGEFAYRRMLADEILAYSCVKRNAGKKTDITNDKINNQTKQHYEKVSDYFGGRKRDGGKSDRGKTETGEGVSPEPSTGEHGRGGANDGKEEGIDSDGLFSVSGKRELKDNTLMPDSEKPEWLKKTKASSGDGEEMTLGEYYDTLYGRRRRMMPTISPLLESAKEKITDDGHLAANDTNGRVVSDNMFFDNTGELSRYKDWLLGTLEKSPSKTLKEEILREIEYLNQQYTHWNLARKGRLAEGFGVYGDFAREFGISKETRDIAKRNGIDVDEVFKDGNGGFFSAAGRKANGADAGYDSKHTEIEQAVNRELEKNSTSDEIKAEIDRVKKLRAEATKEYLSGKPHSEVAKGDAAALRERLNELNAKKTIAVENERSAKLTDKLADLNSKLIEATENGDAEKVKSLTTEIKRLKTDIANTGIRSRYKAKISEIKSKSENVSDLAKSLVKYISGELSPILAKEMGKAEFNALVGSVRDIAKQWNAKDGTEQDRNNLATKLDDTIRKVDDVIVGIETRKLINDLADMLSVKTTKKDSSGKKIGVKVSNTVRIAIETLKGMFRGFDGEFGNGLKSLVKSLDGMLAKKKSLQGRLKEFELSESSVNERLNSGAITKDEYDAEIEAINRERDDVKSEMANFDTVFSDALSETNDAIDTAVPRSTEEYNKLWNDLMAKQQDEQDGVAQMSAHDKEMLKIMPFVRSLVDVRELFAEADKSQSRLKALEEQWKSDAPTPTDTEMEAANRMDRRLQTALKIREERARLFAAKDAARKALRDLNNDVRSLLKIGKTQYMAQQQERLEHRSEVAHIGITAVDTGKERPAGVKGQQEAKESEDKSVGVLRRLWNWVFLAPTESAESMLSRVDVNHFSGEGELYHLIMESERGYSRSEDRRIESVEGLRSEIQSKCKELFGSKKPKDGNKKIKFTQTLSGEPVPAEVTKGEALSLYLWSLSEEGRAKLESQGIDAFSISEIKAGLGDNWVKFGEWVVGDFLPKLYDKYNEKYVEKYGTEITRHENYFPFKIYGGDIVTKDELESFDNGNTIPMPSALKERVKHSYQLSTTEDALKILNEHVAEMEDWYHFADMREDISTLLSSRAFRETLKLQGPNKWRKFRDAMHTLAGVDKRDESVTAQVINEAQSMYASSAVGFRYWTALKQLQSMIAGVNYSYNPRFQARLFANILMPVGTELLAGKVKNAENTFAGMVGSCYWAWKNLPQFRERYRNGKMGNIMLEYESVVGNSNSLYRWIKKNVSQKGLFLNQVFDAAAVAVYSKSIYDYEYTRSIRKGATEEDAHKYAMTCAETNYNKTQQSSGRAYVSKMQVSGNPIEKGLTTFQTASLGFMRKSINDINDIQRAYRLLRLGKEKPLHSISKGAKATVDLLWDGVVMPASWNLINVIGVAGFYYGAKAIFNALFGGDDDNAPIKDATGKTALDRFIEGHSGDVAFATISAPLQGTILNNLVNSAWSGYGGWTPTMAEGAISEVLRSAGETLKGYKDSDSLSGYIEDLDEDAAKYTIKTVLYALFRGYTGIDMKTVERFYNAFYDYKVKGSSLNLISAANFLSTPMSSMRDHEAKDYYLGAYGKTSETAKDLEDYIVKRAYADGKIFKREVESGGARGKVAELFRSRAFKRDLNKYVDEWAEYHIRDASDATDYHDEWLKNHERKEIIRKNRELEYSDEQAKQKTDSLKLSLGYEQKSGNSERTLRYNLVHDILRQIKKKLTGGDNDRKEAFALMKELERIDKVKGHTHSDYVKLAEKAGVKDFQMIPKGVSESGKYVNKSDIDNGTVARGEVKGSYGIIATADDVKADARFRKLQDGSEKQKAKAKEVMKMYSDGDISYQDAYRRMTDIGDGLVTAVYASEADRLIKDLKTKLTKAVKAGDDKASDAIMEQIRSIRGKVIDGDMKPKEEVAKMLLNSIR